MHAFLGGHKGMLTFANSKIEALDIKIIHVETKMCRSAAAGISKTIATI